MRHQILSLAFLSVGLVNLNAQSNLSPLRGGGTAPQSRQQCMTTKEWSNLKAEINEQIQTLTAQRIISEPISTGGRAEDLLLEWPTQAGINFTEWNVDATPLFVDLDPAFPDSLLDYNCGKRTYDLASGYNHSGTDID